MPDGMSNLTFFVPEGPFALQCLAETAGAEVLRQAPGDGDAMISGVATVDEAGPGQITFFDNTRYAAQLAQTHASAIVTSKRYVDACPKGASILLARDPGVAFGKIVEHFYPQALTPLGLLPDGLSVGAHVAADTVLEADVTVEHGAVLASQVSIGTGTRIGANTTIAPGVKIGRHCSIGPNVSIQHAVIGDDVIIHPGVRIGQDGFGYSSSAAGHVKVPQIGRVIIQDHVEIGANACVDRGALRDTVVGEGSKIDNLAQIGHNAQIGRHCLIVAGVSLAGSVTLEDFVAIGGHTVVNNHVTVGMGAQIAGFSAVRGDVPPGSRLAGMPAKPVKQWMREVVCLERFAKEGQTTPAARKTNGEQG